MAHIHRVTSSLTLQNMPQSGLACEVTPPGPCNALNSAQMGAMGTCHEHGPKAMPGNEKCLGAPGRVFNPLPRLWGVTRAFRPLTTKPHSSGAITSLHEEAGSSLPAWGSRSLFDLCREGALV